MVQKILFIHKLM